KSAGFTLIELAIVLVIIGIILGAVLKGQELINNARAKRIQNDLRGFESMMWTYYDRKGRFPGDCNGNGIHNGDAPPLGVNGTGTPPSNYVDPAADYCSWYGATETINTPFSDLRVSRIATYGTPNRILARHHYNDYFKIGSTAAIGGIRYNVIVVYGVPAWLAKMVDVSIDGTEDGSAGRIRNYSKTGYYAGYAWPADTFNDQLVAVSYFFDKSPS
ncbi:MAG: prepilin-type N-terminal cleavage/methylation domain-containing protein, partial [Thermodesulfovibrionales bacterium]|nr:prepilin-type N-terminal cleavage/methylation domain-containing protein [Thermodesulfovibrionales bacterium]